MHKEQLPDGVVKVTPSLLVYQLVAHIAPSLKDDPRMLELEILRWMLDNGITLKRNG